MAQYLCASSAENQLFLFCKGFIMSIKQIKLTNKFTEQLLELDPYSLPLISDAATIMHYRGLFMREIYPLLKDLSYDEYIAFRATIICFLAALSDEDLQELKITNQY